MTRLHAIIDTLDAAITDVPITEMGQELCDIKRATDRLEEEWRLT